VVDAGDGTLGVLAAPVTGADPLALPSNDNLELVPRTAFDGPVLTFDFPALRVGVAEYDEGPTGCTVFHFPAGAALAVDVRGGSAAVVGDYGWTHAVCFAGGSIYGLEAISGVAAELFAQRDYSTRWDNLALTAGAIQPFHAPEDGDALFAVATGEVEDEGLAGTALGLLASELAWDAALNSFGARPPADR
jgi:L-aminopeptidase/D-esterase-like protein